MVVYVPSHKYLQKKKYHQINHTHEHDHHHRDHRRNHYNHTLSQQGRTLRDKKRKHQRKVCPYILRKTVENFYGYLNSCFHLLDRKYYNINKLGKICRALYEIFYLISLRMIHPKRPENHWGNIRKVQIQNRQI